MIFLCWRERIYAGTRYNTAVRTSTSFILRWQVTEIYACVFLLPRSLWARTALYHRVRRRWKESLLPQCVLRSPRGIFLYCAHVFNLKTFNLLYPRYRKSIDIETWSSPLLSNLHLVTFPNREALLNSVEIITLGINPSIAHYDASLRCIYIHPECIAHLCCTGVATGEQIASRKLKAGLEPSRGILNISRGPAFMCMHMYTFATYTDSISKYHDPYMSTPIIRILRATHVSFSLYEIMGAYRFSKQRYIYIYIILRGMNSREENVQAWDQYCIMILWWWKNI